MVQQMIKWNSK